MIDLSINQHVVDFVQWLNKKNLTDAPCNLAYVANLNQVFGSNEESGWAAYVWGANQIMLPGDMSACVAIDENTGEQEPINNSESDQVLMLLTNLAHEYCHHIQASSGREPDEPEAEKFAYDTVTEYLNSIRFDGRDNWGWEARETPLTFP